jgi:hypothetical protein
MRVHFAVATLALSAVAASCGSTTKPQSDSTLAQETARPFVGVWKGSKEWLSPTGEVQATAVEWVVEIVAGSPTDLRFTNGPIATVSLAGTMSLDAMTFPPFVGPLAPGPAGCQPTTLSINGGSGNIGPDGALSLTVNWTSSCSTDTANFVTHYSLQRADALSPWDYPSL